MTQDSFRPLKEMEAPDMLEEASALLANRRRSQAETNRACVLVICLKEKFKVPYQAIAEEVDITASHISTMLKNYKEENKAWKKTVAGRGSGKSALGTGRSRGKDPDEKAAAEVASNLKSKIVTHATNVGKHHVERRYALGDAFAEFFPALYHSDVSERQLMRRLREVKDDHDDLLPERDQTIMILAERIRRRDDSIYAYQEAQAQAHLEIEDLRTDLERATRALKRRGEELAAVTRTMRRAFHDSGMSEVTSDGQ